MRKRAISIETRLLDKISPEPNSGCWLWIGATQRKGYGAIRFDGKFIAAHRVSYTVFRGKIPDGLELDHLCRVHCCINPDHLEAVSHSMNVHRGKSPSANNARKTHCKNGHAFTPENTYIKPSGDGRECRICKRTLKVRWWKRVKATNAEAVGRP